MVHYDVPLYNNPDGTHCYQSSLRMALKYFEPHKEHNWQEMRQITAKEDGLWTWPMAGMLWLQSNGYDVRCIEAFDYQRFVDEGEQYMIEEFGQEVGGEQIAHSNIPNEITRAQEFLTKAKVEKRAASIDDIKSLLDQGYLVACMVNSRLLNGLPGYVGHSILIVGYDNNVFFVNDSGGKIREAQKDRTISFSKFEEVWAYPNDTAKNIIGIKLR